MRLLRDFWFPTLCLLIVGVSLYDAWLLVEYSYCIADMEENPVGLWLINLNGGSVEVFVRAKLAGTLVVITVLAILRKLRSRKTLPVTTSLAAWQTALLTYLTLG